MGLAYKVLMQSAPSAAILTDGYTVPGSTQAILDATGVTVCNRSATPTTFRVSIAVAGAADINPQYLAYDQYIAGNQSLTLIGTPGKALGAGDVIRVYNTLATLSFNASGLEIS